MNFTELSSSVRPEIIRATQAMGYTEMTDVYKRQVLYFSTFMPYNGKRSNQNTPVPALSGAGKHRAIPHNSKCRYGERGAADAKPEAQIILDAAKVSAASGGNSEPKQGQRSQSARGFAPEARCGYRNPTLSSILATQMPCRSCRSGT